MITNRTAFLAAASLALLAGSARAAETHDHAAMPVALKSAGIAEGTMKNGVRTVEMQVTEDGFVPAKIKAGKGEKLRLVITRKTDRT
ncbi:MAG TPA: hypothetical protein VF875_18440, partial [Anaeromyxobacter sp.]